MISRLGAVFCALGIGLLNELGFGLDLTRCAANGTADDLIYVSPRTGRAVSREGGAAYRDRLLALPAFFSDARQARRGPRTFSPDCS